MECADYHCDKVVVGAGLGGPIAAAERSPVGLPHKLSEPVRLYEEMRRVS